MNSHESPHPPARPFPWLNRLLLWLLLPVSLAALCFEADLPARIERKRHTPVFTSSSRSSSLLESVTAQTREQIRQLTPAPKLEFENGSRLERAARAWRQPKPKNSWANGCLTTGLLVANEFHPNPTTHTALIAFANQIVHPNGTFTESLHGIEQAMVGSTLLHLSSTAPSERYLTAARSLTDFLVVTHPKTRTGTLPYSTEQPNILLVDTLGITCPFLAEAGARFKRPEASNLAATQLVEFIDRAIDPTTGLPWHAYEATGGPAYGILGWTRGAGWYAIGLAETLKHLPQNHPQFQKISAALSNLAKAVAPFQLPNGLWRWCLSQPEGDIDTSGSAMLAWAFHRALRLGLLDPNSKVIATRAADGLTRFVDQFGRVHQALGECQAVGHYPRIFGRYPWGQGATTAALAISISTP